MKSANKVQDSTSSSLEYSNTQEVDVYDDSNEFTLYRFASKPSSKSLVQDTVHDTAEGSSQKYIFDDSSSDDSDFARKVYQSSGCFAPLERIPLPVKLLLSIALALLSVIAFGAVIISSNAKLLISARQTKRYAIVTDRIGDAVSALQQEREHFVLKNCYNILVDNTNTSAIYVSTDRVLRLYGEYIEKNSDIVKQFNKKDKTDAIHRTLPQLSSLRNETISKNLGVVEVAAKYSSIISMFLDLLILISEDVPSSDPSYLIGRRVVSETENIKEALLFSRALVLYGLTKQQFSTSEASIVAQTIYQFKQLKYKVFLIFPPEDLERATALNQLPDYRKFENMTQIAVNELYTNQTGDPSTWWNVTRTVVVRTARFHDEKTRQLSDITQKLISTSSGIVVVVIVIVILIIVASIALGTFFSRTIIGPWTRMLELQDETMNKYVPKGFLRLMGRSNLYDVKLGDICSPNLDIFFADIRSFTTLSEAMGPSKTFEFLNAYLSRIGPVFKRYSGFIDSYIGDGIMALFDQRPCWSISAAIEIQRRVGRFNQEFANVYPELKLGIGIHSGDVSCGLVGSEGRVQGTMISDAVNTASRIESLTKRYGAKILVSFKALENIPPNCDIIHRYIGRVLAVGKHQGIDLYQILDDFSETDRKLCDTKAEFEAAMNYMFREPYDIAAACSMLKVLVDNTPGDTTSQLRYNQCVEMLSDEALLKNWNGLEIITSK